MSNISDEKGKFDELVEDQNVKILIEPKALMHVIGTKMDFVDDKLRYLRNLLPTILCFQLNYHPYVEEISCMLVITSN